ncbi:MAG: hypothetical protein ACTSWN_01805 [Promethearchaeota archaeon]
MAKKVNKLSGEGQYTLKNFDDIIEKVIEESLEIQKQMKYEQKKEFILLKNNYEDYYSF